MTAISNEELTLFKRRVSLASGYRLESYKDEQLNRQLTTLMQRSGCSSLEDYFNHLKQEDQQFSHFIESLTINETEFFRNPERFKELKKPLLGLSEKPRLRVWSAGCSTGAEAYSLMILLENLRLAQKTYFLATDIDRSVLKQAREGYFSSSVLKNVSMSDLNYYFEPKGDEYQVKSQWRNKLTFETHDLLQDPYPRQFDLIACRNVMIYFNKDAKEEICQHFYDSLRENGILFIGGAEQIHQYETLGFHQLSPFLYQKT